MARHSADYGERMLQVTLYFWTNGIAKGRGKILPRHVWGSGMLRVEPNKAHGIPSRKTLAFHSLLEMSAKIESLFLQNGITVHPSRRMKKYSASRRAR